MFAEEHLNPQHAPFAASSIRNAKHSAGAWLAYYTVPRHEKAVARSLEYRQVDCFLPLVRQPRKWKNGQRVKVDEPLFPGYIFARISPKNYFELLTIPGVLWVVGPARHPSPVEEGEIECLRAGIMERNSRPHPFLTVGHRARITVGAFAGKTGILVKEAHNLRVVLTIEAIMKSFSVEVNAEELEVVC